MGPYSLLMLATVASLGALPQNAETPAGALFECPESAGLCVFERGGKWRNWWAGPGAESLFEYQVGVQGHVAVRLAGHQWDGEVLVLDPAGTPLLRRLLAAARPLAALVGWLDDGSLVLCNDTHREALCDIIMGSPTQAVDPLSPGCLFPRFSQSGSASCFKERDSVVVTRNDEGRWVLRPIELPRSIVGDFQVFASGDVVLVAAPRLYRLAPGSHHPKVVDRVWRSWYSRGSFFWSRCEETDGLTARAPCTLHQEGERNQTWELGSVPVQVQQTAVGTVMVEYREAGKRTIVELMEECAQAHPVWQQPSP